MSPILPVLAAILALLTMAGVAMFRPEPAPWVTVLWALSWIICAVSVVYLIVRYASGALREERQKKTHVKCANCGKSVPKWFARDVGHGFRPKEVPVGPGKILCKYQSCLIGGLEGYDAYPKLGETEAEFEERMERE